MRILHNTDYTTFLARVVDKVTLVKPLISIKVFKISSNAIKFKLNSINIRMIPNAVFA